MIGPIEKAKAAKSASHILRSLTGAQRSIILSEMATQLELERRKILGIQKTKLELNRARC